MASYSSVISDNTIHETQPALHYARHALENFHLIRIIITSHHNDDDAVGNAPSAVAGNRVNCECYMQVREHGCTTPVPALVHYCVAGL